jgi:uncharacterized protein (TIGR02284 family)
MEGIDKTAQILNDLLLVNHDRVEGYKLAGYNAKDLDLKSLFSTMADESRKHITEITREIINRYGYTALDKTIQVGNIYRVWLQAKIKFTGTDVKNLLASCEEGEASAVEVYKLAKTNLLNQQLIELIERQEHTFIAAHDVISSYRKAYSKVENLFSVRI